MNKLTFLRYTSLSLCLLGIGSLIGYQVLIETGKRKVCNALWAAIVGLFITTEKKCATLCGQRLLDLSLQQKKCGNSILLLLKDSRSAGSTI